MKSPICFAIFNPSRVLRNNCYALFDAPRTFSRKHSANNVSCGSFRGFSSSSNNNSQEKPQILVVGGNGFVGGNICQAALAMGCQVHSLSRSGRPKNTAGWVDSVNWIEGDAEKEPEGEYKEVLKQVKGVVAAVGAFGSNEQMERICGDINISAIRAAHEAGVDRFGFVSAHQVSYLNRFPPLKGYFNGKRRAEVVLKELYKGSGSIVQPMMVNGTRYAGTTPIPLYLFGTPLHVVTTIPLVRNTLGKLPVLCDLLVPPIQASVVGSSLITSMLSEEKREHTHVITVDDMLAK